MLLSAWKGVGWYLLWLWAMPVSGAFLSTQQRTFGSPSSSRLHVAANRDIKTKNKLSVWEAGIDAQWKALKRLNGGTTVQQRPTFSIPARDATHTKGTRSIESAYAKAVHPKHCSEEEVYAAMDLVVHNREKKLDLSGPLTVAMDGTATALKALAFVLQESVAALEVQPAGTSTNDKGDQKLVKINKGFQGVLELGLALVQSCISLLPDKPSKCSATLPVARDSPLERATISLPPAKASQIWGYTAKKEKGPWKKLQSSFGLWRDHVHHSSASAANNVVDHISGETNDMVHGAALVYDDAVTATSDFQKSLTQVCNNGLVTTEQQEQAHETKTTTKQKTRFQKPAFFFAKQKEPSRVLRTPPQTFGNLPPPTFGIVTKEAVPTSLYFIN